MTKLFTKEFLQDLKKRADQISILDFLVYHQKRSFHDAIIEISEFCELKPEYIKQNEMDQR
jgi:hypothetical protein